MHMTFVILIGIIAIIVILEAGHKKQDKDYDMAKGCLSWILAFGILFLLVTGYFFFCIFRFWKADTKWYDRSDMAAEDKERWSYNVYLPEAEHCFEYYSVNGIRDQRFMVETRAYSSVEEMCAELPEGCQEAIMASLRSTSTEEEDIRGMDVKQYKVNDELLPLITWDEVKAKYDYRALIGPREYYVDEYEDGTYRFVLCVQTF